MEQVIRDHIGSEFMHDKPGVELTDATDLIGESVLDSLGIFVLIQFLEERFEIEIDADEVTLDNFQTVHAVAELVRSKQALASST